MFKAGIVGNVWSLETLRSGIRRQRGKCGPGSTKFAKILGEKLDELANRRWRRATKGQRVPTVRQASEVVKAIRNALAVQDRCSARTVSDQQVVLTARAAASQGKAVSDGGKVTASSYGYSWSTTSVSAIRKPDGTVAVKISRSGSSTVQFLAKWFESISLERSGVLSGGGDFAIKRKHGWDCYTLDGVFVGIAVRVLDKVVRDRFGVWEHGKTVAEAQAEIARKRAIIDAEAESEKAAAKLERASRLLARLGTKASVSYDDARAVGACDPGIRAFADRIGRPITATITLAEIAKVEPVWAVKLARRILTAKAN